MNEVLAYRLVKQKWRKDAFDGEGARQYGGRWNSKGNACVYLAGGISLALLEVMVHLEDYSVLESYTALQVRLPASSVSSLPDDTLPTDWRDELAPVSTAKLGDGWLQGVSSLALAVPSVVVPQETNYLINPRHPDFEAMVESAVEIDFRPDSRLLGSWLK